MKIIGIILSTGVLSALATFFLPWWLIAVVAFLVALLSGLRPGKAFLAGFAGIALFWFVASLLRDIPNDHILSQRMAVLFFKKPSYFGFIGLSVFLGGLVGGMAGWTGALARRAVGSK
jgi:hypothetical protein